MPNIDWPTYRRRQQLRRSARLAARIRTIVQLKRRGYDVRQLDAGHFRVNEVLDLYPTHNQWHDLRTGMRGYAANLAIWVREHLRPNEARASF